MIYFAQAIRERVTYTDFMIGLITLNRYYSTYPKTFYVKEDIVDVFSNQKCKFENIEANNSYNILKKIRIKAALGTLTDPMHRDDTYVKQLFIKRVTKSTKVNDMYENGLHADIDNFLLDNTVKFHYIDKYSTDQTHYDDREDKHKTEDSIKVNLDIKLQDNLLSKFTKDAYFINLPTFRLVEDEDIKMLDIFVKYIQNETRYKKLILISGSNTYKDHFCDKFDMMTTHKYSDGFSSKKLGFNKQAAGFMSKDKGSLDSLLTDCLYIQNSSAGYIDFMQLYNTHKDDLFKYGLDKYKDSYYNTFITRNKSQAIDIIGKELKLNKVFYV